jgi:hypothetical protein
VKVGNRLIQFAWTLPKAKDFDHLEIARSSTDPGAPQSTVYKGKGKTFTDRNVANDVEYRYVLTSFDAAGNASPSVAITATPKRALLVAPPDGAKVKAPPKLVWVASGGAHYSGAQAATAASYYNVQLYRGSLKVLSAWPKKNALALHKKWKYRGRRYRMTKGTYRWYVWPGIGAKADARYGPLLGSSSFNMTR